MPESNQATHIRELVDRIERAVVSIRAENAKYFSSFGSRRLYEYSEHYSEYMKGLFEAGEELIEVVGCHHVPSYFPELLAEMKRTGNHDMLTTHEQRWLDLECGSVWIERREEPAIFKDLALIAKLPCIFRTTDLTKTAANTGFAQSLRDDYLWFVSAVL